MNWIKRNNELINLTEVKRFILKLNSELGHDMIFALIGGHSVRRTRTSRRR